MKPLYKVIIVSVLICLGMPVRAQYFDWIRTYKSCGSLNSVSNYISSAVSDSEGNVYVYGCFHKGAEIDGEELLPVEASQLDINTCIVKFSSDGQMLWHKALWTQNRNQYGGVLQMVGDSMLAFSGLMCFAADGPYSHEYAYYWDTLIQGAPFEGDSADYGTCGGLIYFNLEDGSIKEQHFLNAGYNDTAGNPIYSYWPFVAPRLFGSCATIDHEGNIIMFTRLYEVSGTWDPVTQVYPYYAWERGEIGAMRIMVDGERSFYVHSNSCPRPWNFLLVKFSPHFDSLLAARFLFEPSNEPVDFNINDVHVPPSDPSYPTEAYRAYGCNDNVMYPFAVDEDNNIYVTGSFSRCGYTANDTLIPVDSVAGMYLQVKMIPLGDDDAFSYEAVKGYLIKFDPQLRPLSLKQLDWEKRGTSITTLFHPPIVTDSGLIVPTRLTIGPVNAPIPDKDFLLDGDTLPRWLTKSPAFLRLDKDDGHLLAYGGLHVVGNWPFRMAQYSKISYTGEKNRFASAIWTKGDILFADSLHHYNFQRYLEEVSALVIRDYNGHDILYMELSDLDSNSRGMGCMFSDSSLYIYGNLSNMELHFGDTTLAAYDGDGCETAFIARYVDTAFLRPYVHPVSPPDTQQTEDIRVMVQDDIGCLVAYPNPFRQRVRVRYQGTERLREAFLTDMQGRRERVTLAPVGEGEYSLDFSHLPPAPYLLTLVTHSGRQITARLHSAR